MAIVRLNHAVLFVSDLEQSRRFYEDVLLFVELSEMAAIPNAAFFRAPRSTNDHDLGLFAMGADALPSRAGRETVGLYHLAWEVDTLAELASYQERLARAGALTGASNHGTTKSLYGQDPDGIEFEIAWIVPRASLDEDALHGRSTIRRLALEDEIAKYGATTQGGIGVSRKA